ncbi:hypothetical protein SAVCW2_50540 [Streptomyces avermitilis]|nr:hypothetical protein SAVCW2_50540 [Streptomyces avermitilis]
MARGAPVSSDFAVVIVTFLVLGTYVFDFSAAGLLLGGQDREGDVVPGLVLGDQLGHVVGRLHRRTVDRLDHVTRVQPALGRRVLEDGGDDHPGLHRDVQLLEGGHLGALLGLAELLGVLLRRLLLGLAVRVERVVRDHLVVVRKPSVHGLYEVHAVVGAGHPDGRHVQVPGRRIGLVPGDLQHRLAVVLPERVHRRAR